MIQKETHPATPSGCREKTRQYGNVGLLGAEDGRRAECQLAGSPKDHQLPRQMETSPRPRLVSWSEKRQMLFNFCEM